MASNRKLTLWLPLLISLSMVAGMFVGFKLRDGMPGVPFFYTEKQRPVRELIDLIQKKYVDSVNVDALADTAMIAMLTGLDPHSVYISASELQDVNDEMRGSFSGIGVEFNLISDTMHVIHAIKDGPAEKAGILRGDKVIIANDRQVSGKKMSLEEIRNLMRGEEGSKVTLTIIRNSQRLTKEITRGHIPMSSVDAAYLIAPGTGYIRLNKFSAQTYREFMTELDKMVKQGIRSLVLDLRDNGGGILDEAVEIADEFLEGDKLITYTEGRAFPRKEFRCRRKGLFETGKLAVLINEGSASASEVLVGALQDWDRATIIGRRSFGKGLVQEQYSLSDGSAVRLTIARYYTPSGRSIQRPYVKGQKEDYFEEAYQRGLTPDSTDGGKPINSGKKYKTMGGRTVYAGGGISPDIVLPFDSTRNSLLLATAISGNMLNTAAYRILLNDPSITRTYTDAGAFGNAYTINESDWQVFSREAQRDSVKIDTLNAVDKTFLQKILKASIARIIWRSEGYFEVYNKEDEAIRLALETLSK